MCQHGVEARMFRPSDVFTLTPPDRKNRPPRERPLLPRNQNIFYPREEHCRRLSMNQTAQNQQPGTKTAEPTQNPRGKTSLWLPRSKSPAWRLPPQSWPAYIPTQPRSSEETFNLEFARSTQSNRRVKRQKAIQRNVKISRNTPRSSEQCRSHSTALAIHRRVQPAFHRRLQTAVSL